MTTAISLGQYVRIGGSDLAWQVKRLSEGSEYAVLESGQSGRHRTERTSNLKPWYQARNDAEAA